jgi:hypothetical protein
LLVRNAGQAAGLHRCLRMARDTERMVLLDVIYSSAAPTGWALIPQPTHKERRFCRSKGIEIIEADIADLLAAAGGAATVAEALPMPERGRRRVKPCAWTAIGSALGMDAETTAVVLKRGAGPAPGRQPRTGAHLLVLSPSGR